MGIRLHWKILLATAAPLLGLTVAALWTVNRSISHQARQIIQDDLIRAASIFEEILAARSEELAVASQVIVQDPKFFAVLTLPGSARDPELLATAEGVAADFNAITHADLFLVFDTEGHRIANASRTHVSQRDWAGLVLEAGNLATLHLLVDSGRQFQVALTPIHAGNRRVGVLLLGSAIGQDLAARLRALTRSEVTFLSEGRVTASTLEGGDDRRRLALELSRLTRAGIPAEGTVIPLAGARATYMTVAREIRGSAPGDGQLFAVQRSLEAETAFLAPMRLTLVEIGLLTMVISLGVGYLISRGVTAPVRTLVRGAEEMERGNYDYPVDVRTRDEIGYLARRFRDMRQQQRVYVKSLEEVARFKGDFIDVASHELKTPLSILKGFLELLAAERLGPITPHQQEAIRAMEGGVATLTRIAEDASRVSQIQSERLALSPGVYGVDGLLEEAVRQARVQGQHRRVEIHLEPPGLLEAARVDGARLIEAIVHLIGNGIRFTPDGGEVRVRAERDGTWLLIHVEDTGIGLSPERLASLLERGLLLLESRHHHSSSTLEFNSAGLGLGIPFARGVAEAHGGRLLATSEPGRGSRFTLRIPARWTSSYEEAA